MDLRWTMLFWFLKEVATQSSNCDFYDRIDSSLRSIPVNSPNYPRNYGQNLRCRWIIDCPSGYNCRLDCPEVSMPQSTLCMLDKLLVSRSGDPQLIAAETYCGRGSLSIVSTRQRISLGLISTNNTKGGTFRCEVSAQPINPDSNCSCGLRRQNRIVGGKETGVNEYPMMVGIVDARIVQIKCGGDHIKLVCADGCTLFEEFAIGQHCCGCWRTQCFEISNYDYDIGLIRVSEPIEFSDRVGPVCLPFKFQNEDFFGKKVKVLGWGTIFIGGPDSSVLLEADLDVISMMQCLYKEPSVTYRQMCIFTRGKDACQDDSGGPLLYTDPKTALLFSVGIVSNGRSCASGDYPGINTRVTSFLDWIVATTKVNYCVK